MDVDGALGVSHYPGSGQVNTPAVYPQRNRGGMASHMPQCECFRLWRTSLGRLTTFKSLNRTLKPPNSQIEPTVPVLAPIGTHRSTMVLYQALTVRMVLSNLPTHSPTSPGAFTPNTSAGHMPLPTPVSSMAPLRHEVTYGHDAVGSPGSSGYFSANSSTRPPTAASRATGSKPLPLCSLKF